MIAQIVVLMQSQDICIRVFSQLQTVPKPKICPVFFIYFVDVGLSSRRKFVRLWGLFVVAAAWSIKSLRIHPRSWKWLLMKLRHTFTCTCHAVLHHPEAVPSSKEVSPKDKLETDFRNDP